MILLKNLNVNDITFEKPRKTGVGATIIDVNSDLIQTCWCKILYDVDYAICTDVPEQIRSNLQELDSKIIDHCSEVFKVCHQELTDMYKPFFRTISHDGTGSSYLRMPISTNTIMWNQGKHTQTKKDIQELLSKNDYVRFIFKIKKLYFKDNCLTVQIELVQVEKA
jgi:hypothetical protein